MLNNIESRGIHTGFDFLGVESGFDIAEHLIDYSSTSSNLRVFYVGLVNTIALIWLLLRNASGDLIFSI
jgi:general L-amino acid transport system permease protein